MEGQPADPGGRLAQRHGRDGGRRRHRRRSRSPAHARLGGDDAGASSRHGAYRERGQDWHSNHDRHPRDGRNARQPAASQRSHEPAPQPSSLLQASGAAPNTATLSPDTSSGTPTPPNASSSRFAAPVVADSPPRLERGRHRGSRSSHRSRRRSPAHSLKSLAHSVPSSSDLPYAARGLSRWDFAAFEPLFAHYLDIQKQIRLTDLDEYEVRGRWKSFVGRWNRGQLAEGWYEPEMFLRVVRMRAMQQALGGAAEDGVGLGIGGSQVMTPPMSGRSAADSAVILEEDEDGDTADDGDDGEGWGPMLPPAKNAAAASQGARHGPGIPTLQDLEVRRETDEEARQAAVEELRRARRADRAEQKERLDELVPRAEPGSRERALEKKQMLNEKMRGFREPSPGEMEVREADLMGGNDGVNDYRRMLVSLQRRKTERETRREEAERAKREERDERLRDYREREQGTVDMLRELARQRFPIDERSG